MGCDAENEMRYERYFAFFRSAPLVERISDPRLRLTSGDMELEVVNPEVTRLQNLPALNELRGAWKLQSLNGPGWGIGLTAFPGHLLITGNRIAYSPCQRDAVSFRYNGGRLNTNPTAPLPAKPDCAALAEDYHGPGAPRPIDVLDRAPCQPDR
ncbi:hypothetical protein ABVV53_05370 [Novosphingobium sp. RD2P27]|uniref:Uncharacterized protein n=1 Tax=Novosphingobium kalidii TaxID=3230299 RepID=A0ABV2CZ55_9SPHN